MQNGLSSEGFDSLPVCSSNSNQMSKANVLTILVALFPSYASLYCDQVSSGILLVLSTIIFGVVTGANEGEEKMKDKIQMGWILHIVGVFIVIGVKSIQ